MGANNDAFEGINNIIRNKRYHQNKGELRDGFNRRPGFHPLITSWHGSQASGKIRKYGCFFLYKSALFLHISFQKIV